MSILIGYTQYVVHNAMILIHDSVIFPRYCYFRKYFVIVGFTNCCLHFNFTRIIIDCLQYACSQNLIGFDCYELRHFVFSLIIYCYLFNSISRPPGKIFSFELSFVVFPTTFYRRILCNTRVTCLCRYYNFVVPFYNIIFAFDNNTNNILF